MNISLSSGLGSRSLPANSVVGPFMEGSELLIVCESGGGKPIPQVTRQSSENPSHRYTHQSSENPSHRYTRQSSENPTHRYPSRVQKTHPTDNPPEFRKPIPPSKNQKTHPTDTPPEFRKPIPQVTRQSSENPSHM